MLAGAGWDRLARAPLSGALSGRGRRGHVRAPPPLRRAPPPPAEGKEGAGDWRGEDPEEEVGSG